MTKPGDTAVCAFSSPFLGVLSDIGDFATPTIQSASMRGSRPIALVVLTVGSTLLHAQEVKFLDLRGLQSRTQLRYPPAPPADCSGVGTSCVGGGYGGAAIADGAPDIRDPHALGVYLLRVTPTDIDPTQPFEAEFRVLNTGLAPIELPVSPNLSELQSSNDSESFNYFSLALVVALEDVCQAPCDLHFGAPFLGFVELYGSSDQKESMLVLRPGEWITVRANVKFQSWPSKPLSSRVQGTFWLRRNTFRPHPGGAFTDVQNLYPNVTPTPWIDVHLLQVHLLHPTGSDTQKH